MGEGDELSDATGTVRAELMRAVHDEHAAALWSFALRLTGGDRIRAQDLVQECLLRAWRHPEALDESRGSVRGWLFTTARRIAIDEWRRGETRPEVVTADLPEVPVSDGLDAAVGAWVMDDALRALSPAHREVLMECFYRGNSVADAAEHLGVPAGTVKSRTYYALRALKLALQERGVTA